jgi:hypothetical protein
LPLVQVDEIIRTDVTCRRCWPLADDAELLAPPLLLPAVDPPAAPPPAAPAPLVAPPAPLVLDPGDPAAPEDAPPLDAAASVPVTSTWWPLC